MSVHITGMTPYEYTGVSSNGLLKPMIRIGHKDEECAEIWIGHINFIAHTKLVESHGERLKEIEDTLTTLQEAITEILYSPWGLKTREAKERFETGNYEKVNVNE